MRNRSLLLFAAILLGWPSFATKAWATKVASPLRDQFRSPAPEYRPLVRWWWFGVALTKEEIERELVQMHDAGFGGVEIQPVSPLMIYGVRDALASQPFLAQDFLDALSFATTKAKALGLTVDVALGSAWPIGGPHLKPDQRAGMLDSEPSTWPAGMADQLRAVGDKLLAAADKTALSSARLIDIPEGDGLPWNSFTTTRWAASATHLLGKPVASAQVWRHVPPTFRASPLDLKLEADQAFLAGATQVVGHGWPYSPAEAGSPGWAFDTAAVVNAHNPWWPVMPELTMYLRRLSFALRQGDSVSDVAVYLPTHDASAMLAPGDVNLGHALSERIGPDLVSTILRAGYNFDLIDDNVLQDLAETSGKRLKIGRQQFRVIILPNVERIPLATLEKLEVFVASGGTVFATRRVPSRLPSPPEAQEDAQRLTTKLANLFTVDKAPATLVRDELGELSGLLRRLLEPDMRTAMVAPYIGFVHRRTGGVDIYFLANTWNVPYTNTIELRVPARLAEWWDPVTGEMSPAEVTSSTATSTTVQVSLPAYGSKLLVFGLSGRGRPPKASKPKAGTRAGTRAGAEAAPAVSMDITDGWEVTFEGTVIKRHSDWLTSWTESADTRTFSGEAVYRKTVTITQPKLLSAHKIVLSLGEDKPLVTPSRPNSERVQAMLEAPVREAATVLINGQRVGSLWRPPYELELGKRLRQGENTIEIHVFNLGINHLAGKPLGDYARLNASSRAPFQPESKEPIAPLPAGLFGPIKIIVRD